MKPRNTICLWFDKDAHEAARFYAATFPGSEVTAVHEAPGDYPGGKKGAKKVKAVVDSTGAGDAYVAGFIAGIVRGYDPFSSAHLATAVAAGCVTAVGTSTAIRPFRDYLRKP